MSNYCALTVDEISRVASIFSNNKWDISFEPVQLRFNDYCDMLSRLNINQRDLVMELTKDFLYVDISTYLHHFYRAFQELLKHNISNAPIIFARMIRREDEMYPKSQGMSYYLLFSSSYLLRQKFPQVQIMFADSIDKVNRLILKLNPNYLLCLVDDFIGSGETAIEVLASEPFCSYPKRNVVLLTLVGQASGIDRIQSNDVLVFSSIQKNKAITDKYGPNSSEHLVMKEIEDIMMVDSKYRFGYAQSEAIVSMVRTPNNTLPIFWYDSDTIPKVPFPRTK